VPFGHGLGERLSHAENALQVGESTTDAPSPVGHLSIAGATGNDFRDAGRFSYPNLYQG
jgi:hypothetical protein